MRVRKNRIRRIVHVCLNRMPSSITVHVARSTAVLLKQGWGQVQNGHMYMYVRYGNSSAKAKQMHAKSSQTTSLCYSIVKSTL